MDPKRRHGPQRIGGHRLAELDGVDSAGDVLVGGMLIGDALFGTHASTSDAFGSGPDASGLPCKSRWQFGHAVVVQNR